MQPNIFVTPLEVKFASGDTGEFSGYAAVFGNIDAHGDIIVPGAFTQSLNDHKARGSRISMHVMHGVFGGDGVPVGVWKSLEEDDHGLRVEGKISGVNTDAGRLLLERIKDGALGGLSIGYKVNKDGADHNVKGAKRVLKNIHVVEISLVDDPSNPKSRITELKAMADSMKRFEEETDDFNPSVDEAVDCVVSAIMKFDQALEGKSTPKDMAIIRDSLCDAHVALTGNPVVLDGWAKSTPAIRVIERGIRDEFRVSHTKARAIAERWFEKLPREEGDRKASDNHDEPLSSLLSDFKLPD